MCDGDGGGAGSGGSVGGIGAESDAVGTGFGVDAASAADANSFSGVISRGLSAFASSLDPTETPADAQEALGRGIATAASMTGLGPIGGVIGFGMAATAAAEAMGIEPGSSDPDASSVGVDGPAAEGSAPEMGVGSTMWETGNSSAPVNPSGAVDLGAPDRARGLSNPAPIPLPLADPEPEPEPELFDSEEAQRLRRARRYFGLSGTNVTGPLGLQSAAPVFRPSATPVVTTKRKLGA